MKYTSGWREGLHIATTKSYPEVGRAIRKIQRERAEAGQGPASAYQIWKVLEALRRRVGSKTKKDPKERQPELDRARAVQLYLEQRRWDATVKSDAADMGSDNRLCD